MPLSPWVNPDDDHNGLFEKPVVVLFPNARSTSQGTFTVPPPPKHTTTHQSLCEKLKRMHLPTFIKELGPLSLLAWVNNFILYIRKEMVYSKLLSFSIMRKLRNCVSPLNVKIVRKYFAFAAFFKAFFCPDKSFEELLLNIELHVKWPTLCPPFWWNTL